MSERILKALMHLFAIISQPQIDGSDRRQVVRSFLELLLNQELVEEYLSLFDNYYNIYQEKQSIKDKQKKNLSLSSVKVLKICHEINLELTQQQKRIVLFRLLQFIKTGVEISDQEFEFVKTVSDAFHIDADEFIKIKAFILYDFDRLPNSRQLLMIDDFPEDPDTLVHHVRVSGIKGQIRVYNLESASMYVMRYMGDDELYLNGQLIQSNDVYVLSFGTSIRGTRVRPIFYSDIVSVFYSTNDKERILFEVENVSHRFPSGKIGVHSVNFKETSGHLIGIMGASGAGKTTLLNILNGISKPTTGHVKINGYDIHSQSKNIEGLVGYVSQDDLLIEELTVFQNLFLNARLCFGGMKPLQLMRKVLNILHDLGLFEIKDLIVGSPLNKKISGGQRKRLNIALELIREPAVLFLDEPTSGLSSRDSENIMALLKDLTLKGNLIFTVIHQPSSDIFKMFDNLLLLDIGGFMIYYGNPVDSIIYFKSRVHHADWNDSECRLCGNVNSEQIFNIVESVIVDEYGNLTKSRKVPPTEWYAKYLISKNKLDINPNEYYGKIPEIEFKPPNKFIQYKVFTIRDILSKLSNVQYLIINFIEAPVLAFMLAFIIKYFRVDETLQKGYTLFDNSNLPVYIFMSVIVAIFIGLTVSAEEIIKDRKILNREQFLHLSWFSYLASKVSVLMVISAFQALTFTIIGNYIMEIHGMFFQYWLALFTAWIGANLMGLIISDSFKTVVTIYILIPFLVIPQLILSGIIVPYDKLNPKISAPSTIPWYGEIITARWAYEALAVYQYKENKFEKELFPYDKVLSTATYKKDYWIKSIKNKLNFANQNFTDSTKNNEVKRALMLIQTEIKKELETNKTYAFPDIGLLNIRLFDSTMNKRTLDYLNKLSSYYINLYNRTNSRKDNIIQHFEDSLGREYIAMKEKYTNRSLTEFVRNSNSLDRIIEYKNSLQQKIDPIYKDPEGKFVKAHFYAPFKQAFGQYYPTYWVNIIVLWGMNLLLFLGVYYRVIHRSMAWVAKMHEKLLRKNDE
ncbi:MAG: ATP-binding cassette domain-containing protein [Salinivirgaceae bacterium]|nr:ATP-binding cassette domain-containing protein [Salinivirgaceae bacterium]MDD4746497.1 ATP-binding cassette domain-containing protein [Salinivirgaceae bacterium]